MYRNDHYYEEPNCFEHQFGAPEADDPERLGMSIVNLNSGLHREPTQEEKDEILRCLQESP